MQRVLKFVKYLPQLGWDVTVVTTRSRAYGVIDESLLGDVPAEVRVQRTTELSTIALRRRLHNPAHRLGMPGLIDYVGWPDDTAGWVPFATAVALRLARHLRPDAVFSSSYPYSDHLVAWIVSRTCGIPWVADFRDAWTRNPHAEASRLLTRLNRRAERSLVQQADRITVVDDTLRLEGLEPDDPRQVVIRNGVDDADFPFDDAELESPPSDRFSLSFVGSLYGSVDAAPVFAAIGRLIESGKIDRDRLEVLLVGNIWIDDQLFADKGVTARRVGYVDHPRAVREMRRATALLLYLPPQYPATSGKIFEYLLSGRPILCVAPRENLAYRLVQELEAGVVAEPHDADSIDQALTHLYECWRGGTLRVGSEVRERTLARFSRRTLTAELAKVLGDAARGRAGI